MKNRRGRTMAPPSTVAKRSQHTVALNTDEAVALSRIAKATGATAKDITGAAIAMFADMSEREQISAIIEHVRK